MGCTFIHFSSKQSLVKNMNDAEYIWVDFQLACGFKVWNLKVWITLLIIIHVIKRLNGPEFKAKQCPLKYISLRNLILTHSVRRGETARRAEWAHTNILPQLLSDIPKKKNCCERH